MRLIRRPPVFACALILFAFHPCLAGETPVVTVYSFKSGTHAPYLDVHPVPGGDGNFYGTTATGGSKGFGTVFRCTPAGVRTVLHNFADYPNDGSGPFGALSLGRDGNLYGTTGNGGSKSYGTVYKITPAGRLTILHSFTGVGFDREPSEGNSPHASLVLGMDGNFYGTTVTGGVNDQGTVFRITPAGRLTTLHSFAGSGPDGGQVYAGLVRGRDGNFYGVTSKGGKRGGGTVFKITPAGVLTILHSFIAIQNYRDRSGNGAAPYFGMALGGDSNFYGTTSYGGKRNGGTIFQITPAGRLTTVYSFAGHLAAGAGLDTAAASDLFVGSDGNIYGFTKFDGDSGHGTEFQIKLDGKK